MKKWVLKVAVCIVLTGGLWILSTIDYAYDYSGVSGLVDDQKEDSGTATNDGCDGWAMPIMMR